MTIIEPAPETNLPLNAALEAFTQQALGLAFPQSSFAGAFSKIVQEHFHYPNYIFWRNSKTAGLSATAAALRASLGDIRKAARKILDDALADLPPEQRLAAAQNLGAMLRDKIQNREPGSILADNFEGMPQEFAWACLQTARQTGTPEINNTNAPPAKSAANQIPKPAPETTSNRAMKKTTHNQTPHDHPAHAGQKTGGPREPPARVCT